MSTSSEQEPRVTKRRLLELCQDADEWSWGCAALETVVMEAFQRCDSLYYSGVPNQMLTMKEYAKHPHCFHIASGEQQTKAFDDIAEFISKVQEDQQLNERDVDEPDAEPNVHVQFLGCVMSSATSVNTVADRTPPSPQKRRKLDSKYSKVIEKETMSFGRVHPMEQDERDVDELIPFCQVFSAEPAKSESRRFCRAYNNSVRRIKMMSKFGAASVEKGDR